MKICTNVLSEASRQHDRCRLVWQDNIKKDIGTGCALHPAWLGHDAIAGRFENCNGTSAFIKKKKFLLIDVQRNYHLRKEYNILRGFCLEFLNSFKQLT
jgi:hypothetical protein